MAVSSWFLIIKLSNDSHFKGMVDDNIQLSRAHRYQLSIAT